jgi:hypothetical protein
VKATRYCTLEISVKSGKDSTSTLSLVIHRVRFKNNLQKSTLAFKGGWGGETQETIFDGFLSFFFSLSASTAAAATKIFTAPTFTATIISLEPCALNAEIHEFQHFILRFNKISFLCGYH